MDYRSRLEKLHPLRGARPLAMMFAMALALTALPASIFAQIQLDGNARKSVGPGTGTDWDEILCSNLPGPNPCLGFTSGGLSIAKSSLVTDRPEPGSANQFSTGGSKDEQDITSWRHRGQSPPNKDDLSNAFAAAFTKDPDGPGGNPPHTILAFGMDRYDTSGDAQLGFWFLGDNVQPGGSGNFVNANTDPPVPAKHQNNDLLVLVNFSNGGTVPTIQVFQWKDGAVVPRGNGQAVLCSNGEIPGGQSFCGITNPSAVSAPWPYEISTGPSTTFPPGSFFEGAIDLTAAEVEGCFTGFLVESRSSTSITATLKDFAIPGGGFNLCGISVDKSCSVGALVENQTKMRFTITGKVTNSGAATLYNIALADTPEADKVGNEEHFDQVSCSDPAQIIDSFPIASLAPGGEACYKATFTSTGLPSQAPSDQIKVTANSQADGQGTAVEKTHSATCSLPTIPSALSVTKSCATVLEDTGNNLVVRINVTGQVCNNGGLNLSGVSLSNSINGGPPSQVSLNFSTLAAPNECKSYSFSYYPSAFPTGTPSPAPPGGEVCFPDTVTARANDIFGSAVTPVTATASCKLCPGSTCPTN